MDVETTERRGVISIECEVNSYVVMSFRGGQGGGGARVKRVMTQAINLIFEFLQKVAIESATFYNLYL